MEEFYKIGAEYEFMDSLCSTLFDVKAKYYNLLKAKAYLQIAQDNVKINENFVKIAKKKPDLSTAELNLSEAKVKLLEAKTIIIMQELTSTIQCTLKINQIIQLITQKLLHITMIFLMMKKI